MNVTIPQNSDLLKHLSDLIQAHRPLFKQQRVFERVKALIFGEILVLGRHTLTQLLMVLGLVTEDWSIWYRLFSKARFPEAQASAMVFYE